MKKLFADPEVRLALRAILAGLLSFGAQVQASDNLSGSILRSALIAGLLAFAEVFTPLNSLVGVFKNKVTVTPAK